MKSRLPVGVLLAFSIVVIPALGQQAAEQPNDPGADTADAAGCDLAQDDVRMLVGFLDYYREPDKPIREPTVESAEVVCTASWPRMEPASASHILPLQLRQRRATPA